MRSRNTAEPRRRRSRPLGALTAVVLLLLAAAADPSTAVARAAPTDEAPRWVWPGGVAVVVRTYEAPANPFGPGHRGIDVGVAGEEVSAPDDGVVAFRGVVVDRPLITIDHGGGLVSTLEPVESDLAVGAAVSRGQPVGTLADGGHTAAGSLHLGARLDGEYINPLALLGAIERPVLLPCCA
ncbi:MAG: murein hydrolase activator EnvC family protein [Candidatus Microbacterium stercoravium]